MEKWIVEDKVQNGDKCKLRLQIREWMSNSEERQFVPSYEIITWEKIIKCNRVYRTQEHYIENQIEKEITECITSNRESVCVCMCKDDGEKNRRDKKGIMYKIYFNIRVGYDCRVECGLDIVFSVGWEYAPEGMSTYGRRQHCNSTPTGYRNIVGINSDNPIMRLDQGVLQRPRLLTCIPRR